MQENAEKMQTRVTPNTDSFYAVSASVFVTERITIIYSLKDCVITLIGELADIHCLSIYSSNTMFISKKVGFTYAFFQRYYNFVYRILAVIHLSNRTVHFSDVKICCHPTLPMHFISVYFRTPVTVKQNSYQSSRIFRAASIILK